MRRGPVRGQRDHQRTNRATICLFPHGCCGPKRAATALARKRDNGPSSDKDTEAVETPQVPLAGVRGAGLIVLAQAQERCRIGGNERQRNRGFVEKGKNETKAASHDSGAKPEGRRCLLPFLSLCYSNLFFVSVPFHLSLLLFSSEGTRNEPTLHNCGDLGLLVVYVRNEL